MNGVLKFSLLLLLPVFLFSCKKDEEILIPGNVAPPDPTVETVLMENYVNRVYIHLLGRKPDTAEFAQGLAMIQPFNMDDSSRSRFLDDVLASPEFSMNVFNVGKSTLLASADTSDIIGQVALFNLLLQNTQYQSLWPVIRAERDKLQAVLDIPSQLESGAIDVVEMHRRMVNNYFYDQLNMGTQNFVVSCFQHFLFRYPTSSELTNATQMVDGFPSIVFLQTGQSKPDFIAAFFQSVDYAEGQVRDIFRRYLFREPDAGEITERAGNYRASGNYKSLIKTVFITDEYAGI